MREKCSLSCLRYLADARYLRLLGAMFFTGCVFAVEGRAVEGDPAVVARLGALEYRAADFANFVRLLDPELRKKAMSDPQVMNKLIGLELARTAVLSEARARNWQFRPEISRQIERARDDVIMNTYLASLSTQPKDYPSAADIQAAYDLNRDSFMQPRQYRLAQIFVASPKGADKKTEDAAKEKADDLARKAKSANAKFEDLARSNSDHKSSAVRGGDLGWATVEQVVPEIRKDVIGMDVGEVSEPIRSAAGWHIVRLTATKPAAPRPLIEVRDTIVTMLRQRKATESQQVYISRLLEKNPVAVNGAGLRKIFESAL
jgi:hypothetical protein